MEGELCNIASGRACTFETGPTRIRVLFSAKNVFRYSAGGMNRPRLLIDIERVYLVVDEILGSACICTVSFVGFYLCMPTLKGSDSLQNNINIISNVSSSKWFFCAKPITDSWR